MARLNIFRPLLPDHAVSIDGRFSLTLLWKTDRTVTHNLARWWAA